MVSLNPLKYKMALKKLDPIFKWNLVRPQYFVNV